MQPSDIRVQPPLESQVAGNQLLLSVRPSGSSAVMARVKITNVHPDSPLGSNVRVYQGDVYESATGFDGAATETDVTIIVDRIAGGEILPVGGIVTDPRARKIDNRTWTTATGTKTETVYEMTVPTWL